MFWRSLRKVYPKSLGRSPKVSREVSESQRKSLNKSPPLGEVSEEVSESHKKSPPLGEVSREGSREVSESPEKSPEKSPKTSKETSLETLRLLWRLWDFLWDFLGNFSSRAWETSCMGCLMALVYSSKGNSKEQFEIYGNGQKLEGHMGKCKKYFKVCFFPCQLQEIEI